MKPIKISNTEALDLAIREEEGRATARCIDAKTIQEILSEVDHHLSKISLKKDAIGTIVHADPHAQKFPSAYKYTPVSTQFKAVLTNTGWKVTYISRDITNGPTKRIRLELTESTKANLENMVSLIK